MTTTEFSREFDALYDNLSKGGPSVNLYEKSVYLTHAQEHIIKQRYGTGFELGEDKRRELVALTKPYATSLFTTDATHGMSENSRFFLIPLTTWYIFFEEIKVYAPGTCYDKTFIGVKPITHDEYNLSKTNPFRKPNERKAVRLDLQPSGGSKVVEIISVFEPALYRMRYVEKPSPIILIDFDTDSELSGLDLTIDGVNLRTECKLTSELHRDILEKAVNLAIASTRENTLANKVEINKQNV